jgi:hypothetical protein
VDVFRLLAVLVFRGAATGTNSFVLIVEANVAMELGGEATSCASPGLSPFLGAVRSACIPLGRDGISEAPETALVFVAGFDPARCFGFPKNPFEAARMTTIPTRPMLKRTIITCSAAILFQYTQTRDF